MTKPRASNGHKILHNEPNDQYQKCFDTSRWDYLKDRRSVKSGSAGSHLSAYDGVSWSLRLGTKYHIISEEAPTVYIHFRQVLI